jgi:acetylornithine deacetylase/succinyl-diaminopimelate desuccinylase-like protein
MNIRCVGQALCGVVLVVSVALPSLGEPSDSEDWRAARDRAAELLSQLIRIDTVNPPGGETPAAERLSAALAARGIQSQVLEAAPGRGNVIARLPATEPDGRGPILLLSHLDVVPADPEAWSFPPFSGAIRDGHVFGRGALDDKGQGVVFVEALSLLQESGLPRGRDLVFAATAGEEVDGMGAQWLIENHWERLGPPSAVWNEGGASTPLAEAGGRIVHGIATGEKRSLWLSLITRGEGGHGSMPVADSANDRMVRALTRVAEWETPIRVTPGLELAMERLSEDLSPIEAFAARNAGNPLVQLIAGERLTASRSLNAMLRDTISITVLKSGLKHNVIPRLAEARLDVRLLPDTDAAAFVGALEAVIDDAEVEIVLPESGLPAIIPASPTEHEIFVAIEAEIEHRLPGGMTLPVQANGATDSLLFRARGIPAYGYIPMNLGPELSAAMHGLDERVPLEELERAVRVTTAVLERLTKPVAAAAD